MGERDDGYRARNPRKSPIVGWFMGGVIVIALIVIAYFIFAGEDTAASRGQGMIPSTTASISLT